MVWQRWQSSNWKVGGRRWLEVGGTKKTDSKLHKEANSKSSSSKRLGKRPGGGIEWNLKSQKCVWKLGNNPTQYGARSNGEKWIGNGAGAPQFFLKRGHLLYSLPCARTSAEVPVVSYLEVPSTPMLWSSFYDTVSLLWIKLFPSTPYISPLLFPLPCKPSAQYLFYIPPPTPESFRLWFSTLLSSLPSPTHSLSLIPFPYLYYYTYAPLLLGWIRYYFKAKEGGALSFWRETHPGVAKVA